MSRYFDLSGKVALVTGGSRGLGRAICRAYAEHGADIVVVSRKQANCDILVAELVATGRRAIGIACHVGRWDEIEPMLAKAYGALGRIDVLVNNAGMSPLSESSAETSERLIDAVIALNFKGPFRLSALVGRRMAEGDGGSIINISSLGSIRPTPQIAAYAAAKAALNALTTAHAFEYGPKVRVNAILPGSFRTDIARHWAPDKEANTQAVAGRFGEPEEIATTALYLASDHSRFTTGAMIRVDGGRP